jgi:hypothetical protein
MGDNQNSSMERGIGNLSALRAGLGTAVETKNGANKTTSEIDDKNRIEEKFISSRSFHQTTGERVQETTTGEQFKPRNIKSFDPTTKKLYRDEFLQQSIQSNQGKWMNRCIPIAKTTQQNQRTKLMPDLVTTQENLHLTRTQH